MKIDFLTKENCTEEIDENISLLFKQLAPDIKQIKASKLLEKDNILIATCFDENNLVGIALMANYEVISGYKGWVEDVVVDENYRGKGIGKKLMDALISEGKKIGLSEICLFTSYKRTAAINLYKKLGFIERQSHVFNLKL